MGEIDAFTNVLLGGSAGDNSSSMSNSSSSSSSTIDYSFCRKWMMISASLSVAGTVILGALCIAFDKLKLAIWRSVFFSALSEFVFALMLVIGYTMPDLMDEPNSPLCNAEGFIISLASSFSNTWLLFLMLILFTRVHNIKPCLKPFAKIEFIYFIIMTVVNVAFAVLPLTHVGGIKYGPVSSGWCHISHDPAWARFVQYAQQWFFLFLIVLLMIDVYVKVLPRLIRQRHHIILPGKDMEARRRVMILIKQVWIYPVLLVASWATTTISRIVDAGSVEDEKTTSLITAIVAPLMGFIQLVAFLLTSAVPRELYETCVGWYDNYKLRREYERIGDPNYQAEYYGSNYDGQVQYRQQSPSQQLKYAY